MLSYEKSVKCKNRTNDDKISETKYVLIHSYWVQSADIVLEKKD